MFKTAKALARLSLSSDYIPKEFTVERARECLKSEVTDIPSGIDPLQRLTDNGALLSREDRATTSYRFALDPVAEFLAAEAHYDHCAGEAACLGQLLTESHEARGFYNALLQAMQARRR